MAPRTDCPTPENPEQCSPSDSRREAFASYLRRPRRHDRKLPERRLDATELHQRPEHHGASRPVRQSHLDSALKYRSHGATSNLRIRRLKSLPVPCRQRETNRETYRRLGIFIGRQLARLATESNTTNVRFLEPQPHHESLAIDVFGDGYHVLGIVHGHQAKRPDQMATWWRGQAFGRQPVADASLLIHGHFHHLRVTECGSVIRGDDLASRFIVMAPTIDNGSSYYRLTTGEDSVPGLATLTLHKGRDYTGTVHKH